MSDVAQSVRSHVLDELVHFMCKNIEEEEITQVGFVPTEMELSEFPALRLRVTDDSPPRVFLQNIAVPK